MKNDEDAITVDWGLGAIRRNMQIDPTCPTCGDQRVTFQSVAHFDGTVLFRCTCANGHRYDRHPPTDG